MRGFFAGTVQRQTPTAGNESNLSDDFGHTPCMQVILVVKNDPMVPQNAPLLQAIPHMLVDFP
jgi:hypothetical protein